MSKTVEGVLMAAPAKGTYGKPRADPVWLMLGIVALLAFLSMAELLRSGSRELLVGLLTGAWICVLVGLTFTIWRRKELS